MSSAFPRLHSGGLLYNLFANTAKSAVLLKALLLIGIWPYLTTCNNLNWRKWNSELTIVEGSIADMYRSIFEMMTAIAHNT